MTPVRKNGLRDTSAFGWRARHYTTSPSHAAERSLARLVELLAPRGDWRVIDVAAGAGHTALALAPHVDRVAAVDISPAMLGEARRLAAERGVRNIVFAVGAAEALPHADGAYDAVACRIAAHHFNDLPRALAEMIRPLKAGGSLVVVDNCAAEDAECASWMNAFEKRRDPSHVALIAPSAWRRLLAEAGLDVVALESYQYRMSCARWLANVEASPALTRELLRVARRAPRPVAAHVGFEWRGGELASFGIDRIVILARNP